MSRIKNGFTLTELIAVIIILSIIALITVPLINNVIEDSRKKTFENNVVMLINAIEIHIASIEFEKDVEYVYQNKKLYYIDYIYDEDLEVEVPTQVLVETKGLIENGDGFFTVGNNINELIFQISNGIYCANKDVDEAIVITEGECPL